MCGLKEQVNWSIVVRNILRGIALDIITPYPDGPDEKVLQAVSVAIVCGIQKPSVPRHGVVEPEKQFLYLFFMNNAQLNI
jgi:hypothetical protein